MGARPRQQSVEQPRPRLYAARRRFARRLSPPLPEIEKPGRSPSTHACERRSLDIGTHRNWPSVASRLTDGEEVMKKVARRSALALGLAAASAAIVKPAAAQAPDALAGTDTTPWPGVVVRAYGESPSLIPGFKTVSMRDMIIQPGSKGNPDGDPMRNAMVCHILEGE